MFYMSGNTWGWVNDDRIFTFGWTIPLRKALLLLKTNKGKYSGCVSNRSVEDTLNPQTSVKTQLRYSYFLFSGFDCWYKILLLKPICFSLVFLALTFFCLEFGTYWQHPAKKSPIETITEIPMVSIKIPSWTISFFPVKPLQNVFL